MKKLLIILIAVCGLLYACTSVDEPTPSEVTSQMQSLWDIYSVDEAVAIANDIAAELDPSTCRSSSRKAVIENVVNYKTSKSRNEESPFYVVNYEDNQGYAIIAKKRIAQPVMAVINEGIYIEGEVINNPGFTMFMDAAIRFIESDTSSGSAEIRWQPGDGLIPAIQYKTVRDTISTLVVTPTMQSYQWGQEYPEGLLCPNGKSGCSNTAIFLMMAYFQSPSSILYTYPGAEVPSQNISWKNVLTYHKPTGLYPTFIINTISRICRQLGELGGSDYSNPNQTSTLPETYYGTLKTIFPSKSITQLQDFTFDKAKQYIESGMVLMRGEEWQLDKTGNPVANFGGHAWIVDGCNYSYVIIYTYKKEYDDLDWVLESTKYQAKRLISINWGWNGLHNGYYESNVLNPRATEDQNLRYLNTQFIGVR